MGDRDNRQMDPVKTPQGLLRLHDLALVVL